jgi:hypothetical protein
MKNIDSKLITPDVVESGPTLRVDVLITFWALVESALGGILHAFRIPLTGLFVNGCAVVLMVLIASATDNKRTILRASLIVMIVKGIISPHTPLNAFIAVGFQGLMGEIFLRSNKHLLFSSIVLGVITLLQSALQKIIVLTIIYGKGLWETIDVFVNFILQQLPILSVRTDPVNFSLWLIITYVSIHLAAGMIVGIVAAKMPNWLNEEINNQKTICRFKENTKNIDLSISKKKRPWIKKPSAYIIITLAGIIVILSHVLPGVSESQGLQAVVLIVRSSCILIIWYIFIGPFLIKISQRYLRSKQNAHVKEVEKTLQLLIPMRYIVYKTWNESGYFSGFGRMKYFIKMSLINILSTEFTFDENN